MAKTMTLQGRPMGERFMERREQYFAGIETLTEEQIEQVSNRWHKIANRYQKWVAKITVRRMIATGEYHPEAN
jgi:hypothetical protein